MQVKLLISLIWLTSFSLTARYTKEWNGFRLEIYFDNCNQEETKCPAFNNLYNVMVMYYFGLFSRYLLLHSGTDLGFIQQYNTKLYAILRTFRIIDIKCTVSSLFFWRHHNNLCPFIYSRRNFPIISGVVLLLLLLILLLSRYIVTFLTTPETEPRTSPLYSGRVYPMLKHKSIHCL